MQQFRFLFTMALLYMFRATISPIIRSTMLYMAIYSTVFLMMGEIVTRNMKSKAIANKKRNCCILLDLFHYYKLFTLTLCNQRCSGRQKVFGGLKTQIHYIKYLWFRASCFIVVK